MNPRLRFALLFLLSALCGSRSLAASASVTATAASPGSEVVELDPFVITATPFARNQVDLAQSTTVLGGESLRLKQQPSLGETLAGETGVHATSFGPGSSRPIIRGLGGDRIRLLENSTGIIDASVISPDHAVSVDPLLIERIEVVRGPASLLYGSNAVGGVVNVLTHRIETEIPTQAVKGAAELRGGTAADEVSGGAVLDLALMPVADRAVVLHLDGFRRKAGNLRIPGFAESEAVRAEEIEHAEEEGEEPPVFASGRLLNSSLETQGAAAGLTFLTGGVRLGLSHSGLDSDYGVPGHSHEEAGAGPAIHEGVRIDLRQRRTELHGEWRGGQGWLQGARLNIGHARYRHAEIESDGAVGTVFTNRGHDGRFELLHGNSTRWAGALGVQVTRSDSGAVGEEAFLPDSRTDTAALFAFEEVSAGAVAWQFGARYERTKIAPEGLASRRENEIAGSLGAVWKPDGANSFAFSVTHTGRAPNAQELFANGPHLGTHAFEIGDAALASERSWGFEGSFRRRQGFLTGSVTVFSNRFENYIFEEATGLVAVEDEGLEEWVLVAPDSEEAGEHGGGLPVFQYVQRGARFWGAEIETIWHLHETANRILDLRLAADFTRAREGGRDLPRIPAVRAIAGLEWKAGPWSAGVEGQRFFRQTRVAANETPSEAYTLLGAQVSRRMNVGRATFEIFVRGTNLLDEEARPHTSFIKDLAPLAGRAGTAGVRLQF